jgi:death-on-curing protein
VRFLNATSVPGIPAGLSLPRDRVTIVEYLDLEDILQLVRHLGIGPVRDVGLLDSAVARPRSSAFGEDAYSSISLKAAALLHSITNNHALVDGNKRLAWLATTVFLDLNGLAPELSDDEAFELVWEIASTSLDVGAIASKLEVSE